MSTEQKIRFIEAVMNGELDVRNRRMDDVIADIEMTWTTWRITVDN